MFAIYIENVFVFNAWHKIKPRPLTRVLSCVSLHFNHMYRMFGSK